MLNAVPIRINGGKTAGNILATAVKKEETAKSVDALKNGGTNGCASEGGAACLFLTNNLLTPTVIKK
jgi:hypothetical protein